MIFGLQNPFDKVAITGDTDKGITDDKTQEYPIQFTNNNPLFITFRILRMDRMARRHPQVLVKVKMNNAADTAYHTLEYYLKFDPCPKASIAFTHKPKPSPMIF